MTFGRAAAMFTGLLASAAGRDWSARAGELKWTVNDAAAHVADVCGFYAIHLALRSRSRLRFDVALHPTASLAHKAATIDGLAHHLAQVIDRAPPDACCTDGGGLRDGRPHGVGPSCRVADHRPRPLGRVSKGV